MVGKKGFTLAEVLITLGIIGVVAALTIPSLMTAYKKHVIETRLKHSYSLLNQVVKLAQADYDEPSGWDYTLGTSDFAKTYFLPYMKYDIKKKNTGNWHIVTLLNGVTWTISRWMGGPTGASYPYIRINIDINGTSKPNKQGVDVFNFYILPQKRDWYNTGDGDIAHNVSGPGVYYDGYGFSDDEIKNNYYRGCGFKPEEGEPYGAVNSFCVALIVRNNWKIPKDYPIKF